MGAAARIDDVKILTTFIPLNELESDKLHELAAKSTVRQFNAGESLQTRSQLKQMHYLLSGTIELNPHCADAEIIRSGSDRALRPLCPQTDGNCRAVAKTPVSLLLIDAELLELLQGWGSASSHYQVDEIETDGSDWMSGLLQNPALIKLTPTTLQKLITTIEPVEVKAGEVILRQGERDEHYYIIASGRCRVSRRPQAGAKEITLATLGPGDGFGEEALITGGQCNANVSATEASLVLKLNSKSFTTLLQKTLVQPLPYEAVARLKEQGAETLDVRSPEAFARDGVGINLPLSELRLKASKLARNKKYIACCEDGKKSAVAAFVLSQQGLDVCVLDGGLAPYTPAAKEKEKKENRINTADTAPVTAIQEAKQNQSEQLIGEQKRQIEQLNQALAAQHQEMEQLGKEAKDAQQKISKLEQSVKETQTLAQQSAEQAETHLNKVVEELTQELEQEREKTQALHQQQRKRQQHADELSQTLTKLEAELAQKSEHASTTQNALAEQQKKQLELDNELKKIRQERDTEQQQFEQQTRALQEEIEKLQQAASRSEQTLSENQSLQEQLSSFQLQTAELHEQLENRETSHKQLQEEHQSTLSQLNQLQQTLDEALKNEQHANQSVDELNQQLTQTAQTHDRDQQAWQEESEELKAQLHAAQTAAEETQALLCQTKHELSSSKEAATALQQRQNELTEKLEQVEEQLAHITRQYSDSNITIEQLNESKNRLAIQLDEKTKAFESLTEKRNQDQDEQRAAPKLEQEIEQLKRIDSEKEALITALQSEIKQLTDTVASLKNETQANHSLAQTLDAREALIREQEQNLEQQRVELSANKQRQEELSQQLTTLQSELERATANNQQWEAKSAETDDLKRELAAQQNNTQSLQATIATLQQKLDRLSDDLAQSKQQSQAENSKAGALKSRMDEEQLRYQNAIKVQDSLKEEIRNLRESLHTSQQKQARAEKTTRTLESRQKTRASTGTDRLDSIDKLIAQAPTVDSGLSVNQRVSDEELIKMGKEALSEPIPTFKTAPSPATDRPAMGYTRPQLKASVKITAGLALAAAAYFIATSLLGINVNAQVTSLWQSATAAQEMERNNATTAPRQVPSKHSASFATQEEKLKQAARNQLEQALHEPQ